MKKRNEKHAYQFVTDKIIELLNILFKTKNDTKTQM